MTSPINSTHNNCILRRRKLLSCLIVTALVFVSPAHGFGLNLFSSNKQQPQRNSNSKNLARQTTSPQAVVSGGLGTTTIEVQDEHVNDENLAKRVPVAIRYSAESGMKPYFLTVAKKLKEAHPDVILDRMILPKVEGNSGSSGGSENNNMMNGGDINPYAIFEVLVDGKVVVPYLGRKDKNNMGAVFVSMQELDAAISRARRRRRPSTVYGEEGNNVRLEVLKNKVSAAAANIIQERSYPSDRHSKD